MTTDHVARLYVLTGSVLALFLAWAGIATRPSPQPAPGTASPALVRYEQQLRETAVLVGQVTARRRQGRAAPAVRIVTLPPLTTTRTS